MEVKIKKSCATLKLKLSCNIQNITMKQLCCFFQKPHPFLLFNNLNKTKNKDEKENTKLTHIKFPSLSPFDSFWT